MGGSNMTGREFDDVMHSSDQFSDLGFRAATLAGTDVTNLPAIDPVATYFEWDPRVGGSGTLYDLARGDLASLAGDASGVDPGL